MIEILINYNTYADPKICLVNYVYLLKDLISE